MGFVRNKFKNENVNPNICCINRSEKFTGDYSIPNNIKTKLPKLDNFPGKVIPAVALYNDNPHGYPFWAEFHPVHVIHGIRDKNRINLIMSGLSKNKLNTLEEYIKKWILK